MRTVSRGATTFLAACLGMGVVGCAQFKPNPGHLEESEEQVSRVDKHSSFPAFRRIYFEQLNLVEMIDPKGEAETAYAAAWAMANTNSDERKWGIKYDLVLAHFRESSVEPERKRLHRNSVQDRILAVSTSRCNVFKTYLRRQQSDMNFLLGAATTAAGVLGAVLQGVNASRNLAGAAGLFSGWQAEYNQQYYSNLAAHLLIQGIELRQARMLASLVKDRQGLSVADYSMEAAIKDAILFDGSCSTVTGLAEASESIREVTNPGLPRAFEIVASVRALHEMTNVGNFSEFAESGKLQKLLKTATPGSTPLVVSVIRPAGSSPTDKLVATSKARTRIDEMVAKKGAGIAKAFTDAQAKLPEDKKSNDLPAAKISERFKSAVGPIVTEHLSLTQCLAALPGVAGEIGRTQALRDLELEGTPKRIQADEALEVAKAHAALASGRVELLVNAAVSVAQENADKWTGEVVKAGFNEASLRKLPVIKSGDSLKELCK